MGKTLVMLHKALWMPVPTRKTWFRTRETVSRPPAEETSRVTETAGVYSPGTEGQVSGQEMTMRGDSKSEALAWCR